MGPGGWGKRHLTRMGSSPYARRRLRRRLPLQRVMQGHSGSGAAFQPGHWAVVPLLPQRSGRAEPRRACDAGTAMRCPHQTWPPRFAPRKDGCRAALCAGAWVSRAPSACAGGGGSGKVKRREEGVAVGWGRASTGPSRPASPAAATGPGDAAGSGRTSRGAASGAGNQNAA